MGEMTPEHLAEWVTDAIAEKAEASGINVAIIPMPPVGAPVDLLVELGGTAFRLEIGDISAT